MLGKLLKHEFRATGRIMLPLVAAELLLSVFAGLSVRGLSNTQNMGLLGVMYVTTLAVFFLGLFALGVVAFVLMIQRFYKNLLRDEGYLAMTLPVSVDEQIFAKLIVSFVWFAAVALLSVCALAVVGAIGARIPGLDFRAFLEGWPFDLSEIGGGNVLLFFLELVLIGFLGSCATCLRCYSALAIGHSAADHKMLLSFVAYIGIGFALSTVQNTLMIGLLPRIDPGAILAGMSSAFRFHTLVFAGILFAALYCAIFYFVTRWYLKNKLNLA